MRTPLGEMVEAAKVAVGNALSAVSSAANAVESASPREARDEVYTAKLRLEVAQSIMGAIDLALDMEDRGHGSLRLR